jgi:uncharacterized protein YuzE
MKMRIDKERDIVRVIFRESPIEDSDETERGIVMDYDGNGSIVGLEFLNASKILGDLDVLDSSNSVRGKKPRSVQADPVDYKQCLA